MGKRGALCPPPEYDLENLSKCFLLSRDGAVPEHRLGGLLSASRANPGQPRSVLVSWVEITIRQTQLWPKIMITMGGRAHSWEGAGTCFLQNKSGLLL